MWISYLCHRKMMLESGNAPLNGIINILSFLRSVIYDWSRNCFFTMRRKSISQSLQCILRNSEIGLLSRKSLYTTRRKSTMCSEQAYPAGNAFSTSKLQVRFLLASRNRRRFDVGSTSKFRLARWVGSNVTMG